MNANQFDRPDEFVTWIINAFEQLEIPPRPKNVATFESFAPPADCDHTPIIPIQLKRMARLLAPVAAIAACVVIAISIWSSSQGLVFAQVVEQVKKADAVKFRIKLKPPGAPEISGDAYAKSPDLTRFDLTAGGTTVVNINNFTKGELISFDPTSKEATIAKLGASREFDVIRQLQQLDVNAAMRVVESNTETDPDIDVFEINEEGVTRKVWVDKKTKLPVRIEVSGPPGLGLGEATYSDFDWNATIDAAVFEIPAGYKISRNNLLAEPTEEEFVAALRIRHALSSDVYPADFLTNDCGLSIGRLAYDHSLSRERNFQRQVKSLGPILTAIGISHVDAQDPKLLQQRIDYLCMKVDQWSSFITANGRWVGEGVRPGENKPLCWWRQRGAQNVRVLYADLTIRDADQPPTSR